MVDLKMEEEDKEQVANIDEKAAENETTQIGIQKSQKKTPTLVAYHTKTYAFHGRVTKHSHSFPQPISSSRKLSINFRIPPATRLLKSVANMPLQIWIDSRKKFEKDPANRATTDPPEFKLDKSITSKKIKSDGAAAPLALSHHSHPPESSSPQKITSSIAPGYGEESAEEGCSGRERLKRHRVEVAGRVWIPDMWGQEDLLKDWTDCTAFDSSLVNSSIMSARAALIEESRRANSTRLRIENSC